MKKEGKVSYLMIVIGLLGVVIICLFVYSITLKNDFNNYKKNENKIQNNVTNETQGQNNDAVKNKEEISYDCSFTRTYNIVNILDGYIAEVPFLSYVVIDAFQDNYARTHIIPSKIKDSLENNKTYEFTYTVKGIGIINDMEDIYEKLQWTTIYEEDKEHYLNEPMLKVTLSIKETDKVGMEQKQEPICKTD